MRIEIPPVIGGVLFLAIGIGLAAWGFGVLQNAKASSSWPKAQGQVTSSSVDRKTTTSGSGSGSSHRRKTKYKANVAYKYSVAETAYTSDRVSFGDYSSSNSGHAQEIVNRYPKGKAVEVYYNPKKPQVSVLEPGTSWWSYTFLGGGLIFAIVGGVILVGDKLRASGGVISLTEPT